MVSFVRRHVKSFKIMTTRVQSTWLGLIPIPGRYKLRFLIIQEYDHTSDDESKGEFGTTIIRHDVEKVVDWYDSLSAAEEAIPFWERNIGVSTLERL